jgi:hypothetical protein
MCCALSFPIQYCKQNCSNHSRYLKIMVEDGFLSSANISAALLCMDGAMDDIPLFCPASTQEWRAYHCSKKLMLVSLISDEDFAKISTSLLGNNSAMDDIPFSSSAGAQSWWAYHYLKNHHIGAWHRHGDCHLSHITGGHSMRRCVIK